MANWKPPHPFEEHLNRDFKKELERMEYFSKVCDYLGMPKIQTEVYSEEKKNINSIKELIGDYKHHEWRYLSHYEIDDKTIGVIVYKPKPLKDRIWLLNHIKYFDIKWKFDLDRKDGITEKNWEQYFDARLQEYFEFMEPLPEEYRTKK